MSIRNERNELEAIFAKHTHERICVIGTMCCGKTTLLKQIANCVDMDEVLFAKVSTEEAKFISRTPWTKEIGAEFDRLVYERVHISPGNPMFGTVILDCDVVVCLDISDELLEERCLKRGASFEDAKNMKQAIQRDAENHECLKNKLFYYVKML